MAREKVLVNLDGDRSVKVSAETRYAGIGAGNIAYYVVTVGSHVMVGTGEGDARHLTEVTAPAELRAELLPRWERQERAAKKREFAQMSPAAQDYFLKAGLYP